MAPAVLLTLTLVSCAVLPGRRAESDSAAWALKRLQEVGLLEGARESELDRDSPNAVANLLAERGRLLLIDEKDYAALPAPGHYRPLFEKLCSINGDVDVEVVDLELRATERAWGTEENIVATIRQGGRSYTSALYYSDDFRVSSRYFGVVNRALADAGSPHRLFGVTIFCEDEDCKTNSYYGRLPMDPNRFGIIALSRSQAAVIMQENLLPICCREFDLLTTSEVEQLIEGYRAAGLLDGMSEDEIEQARADILLDGHNNRNGLIYYFDGLVVAFDTETSNFENPYEEITLELASVSRGRFAPQSVVDAYQYDEPSRFSFELGGAQYEATLQNCGDWLDLSFIELINRALAEQGIDGRFYALDDEGQYITLVFLDGNQYEDATRRQLLGLIDIADSRAVEDGQEYEQHVLDQLQQSDEDR